MKITVAIFFLLSFSASADTWNKNNDPSNFDPNYEYRLNALPLKAVLPLHKTPWSSSFWPRKKGGINYRWNTSNPTGFDLSSPSRYTVQRMSLEDLAKLSPAEKFDLAQGHYDYPLSTRVAKNAKKEAKDWEGVCDGWTASAIQFPEPAAVQVTNPDGIVIPFGSADVKALMSYDVSINGVELNPVFVGKYCVMPWGMVLNTPECSDINPGAFHVILANQIGLKQEAFASDVDAKKETWNQPVYGYEFEIRGETSAEGAARAYIVHGKMLYTEDDPDAPHDRDVFSWTPTVGTPKYSSEVLEVDYILELDYAGRIIGGEWIGNSKKNHPDLFWMPTKKIQWSTGFEFLNQLYKPAL